MTKTPEEHYRRMAQAIYDTYALLDFAKSQFRHKNINPFLVIEIFQDIEASLGNVYGEAQLLHNAGQELMTMVAQFQEQREEALAQIEAKYKQGWRDGIDYLLRHTAAENTELLTRLLDVLLKHGDQFALLTPLLAAITAAIPIPSASNPVDLST